MNKIIMNIRELCYELYKVDWMSHMSIKSQMNVVKEYYKNNMYTKYDKYSIEDTLEYYILENGYDGELYVCYDEFLDYEYLNEDYIKGLLNDTELINQYEDDITNNFSEN